MFEPQNRRRRKALVSGVAAAFLLSGCMANPGDAPTVDEEERPERPVAGAEESLQRIQVGVDEFGEGFNPHLIGDASPVTDLVASLTLPSAFEPDPDDPARWRMSPDLLESAELLPVTEPVPDEDSGRDDSGAGSGDGSGDAADEGGSDGSDGSGDGDDGDDPAVGDEAAPSIAAEAAEADPSDARPGDTRIRYRIRSGAQWSDGTPISGSDFRYLHATLLANAGVSDAAAYERIRAITVSGGGRQVDVLVDGQLPEWRTLFRHLLPSHLMRPSATPFTDILDNGLPASGGRYTAQTIDVGRGEVRLVRNDRFWGDVPAKTDSVIIRSVDNAVTGAEQLRAGQLQSVRVRPKQTTAMTYGLVPDAVEVPATVPREMTLHANAASPLLDDVSVRRSILSAIDVPTIAAVATGRTAELEIPPAPAWAAARAGEGSADAPLAGVVDGVTEDDPLLIGVMGTDVQALAAARAIADQLTDLGAPTQVTSADDQELAGSLLPYGRVDMVVAWGDAVNSAQQAANRWSCPSSSRASSRPEAGTGARAGAVDGSADGARDSDAGSNDATAGSNSAERAASAEVARGANLSGLCDPVVDEWLDDAIAGGADSGEGDDAAPGAFVVPPGDSVPGQVREAVGGAAVELGIVVDRVLTVVGSGVRYDGGDDPAVWPQGPFIGPLMTVPEWRRVPSGAESDAADAGDEPAEAPGEDSGDEPGGEPGDSGDEPGDAGANSDSDSNSGSNADADRDSDSGDR
ncbi:ABC transporter substrate-binding protein [uncultured Corynebacterium sp.]|uniref:ABC transporter substrate-binding protein n=1 Tax=uncultured Corynebacterium sp. TaxID=159447 RepID=UPI0025F8BF13|nr:ABC transporter substrate-binding protein [uncultured Corynebacterium sp.]